MVKTGREVKNWRHSSLKSAPDVKTIHGDLIVLNRYYIEKRYPGDFPMFHPDEAQAAFKAAQQ